MFTPAYITQYKTYDGDRLTENELYDTFFGWMTTKILYQWCIDVFIKEVDIIKRDNENSRALLILDSYSSRFSTDFICLLRNNNINAVTFPSSATKFLQP